MKNPVFEQGFLFLSMILFIDVRIEINSHKWHNIQVKF